MGEMPWCAADLPDALVGLVPDRLQVFEKLELHLPGRVVGRQTTAAGLMVHVHNLAEYVELKLTVCRIADAYRRGIFVPRQPRRRPFGQPTLTGNAIHDLQLFRAAGD